MTSATRTALILAALLSAAARGAAQQPNPHVRLGGRDCSDCHVTATWSRVRFDHAATRFPLVGLHAAVPCSGCHDLREFAGAPQQCGACHEDPHRGDAGPRCDDCHTPTGWTQVRAPDAHARTRLPDLGRHASLPCQDCHRSTGVQPFSAAVEPCVGCHRASYDAAANPRHADLSFGTRCDECHQLVAWQPALFATHDAWFPIYRGEHAHVWNGCASCHPVATDYRQFVCTTCHADGPTTAEHQGIPGYQWESTACLGCHPAGGGGDLSFHEAVFPIFAGPHAAQWSLCSQCHVDPASRSVVSCVSGGCHVQAPTDATHQSIPGYAYQTAQCRSCHPDGRAGTFAQHDVVFPIYSGTHAGRWSACATCHTVAGDRSQFSCLSGGCHPAGETNGHHEGEAGYQYLSSACLGCHPDGTKP